MTVFRALTTGLLGTSAWLVIALVSVSIGPHEPVPTPAEPAAPAVERSMVSIVDVASGVHELPSIVRLEPGDRVVAVGGEPVANDLAAGAALAATPRGSGRYTDLDIENAGQHRRVIVLMH